MKIKIVGILVMMLLIGTILPISAQIKTNEVEKYDYTNSLNGGWFKTYGGEGIDSFKGLDFTPDGGYILSGETQIDEFRDAWLVKINKTGDVLWETTYGNPDGWDGLYPVKTTSDGDYISGGWYYNSTQEQLDALLIKTNETGEIIWVFTLGGDGDDEFFGLHEGVDGYLAVGYSSLYTSSGKDGFIAKVDFDGNLLWHKNLEKEGCSGQLTSIINANDGNGYIISGGYYSISAPPQGRILKIDEDGNIVWDQSYGRKLLWEWCTTITNTLDNNYIIVGASHGGTFGFGFLGSDIWLMKVDNNGSLIWEQNHGIPLLKDYSLCVQPTSDGGYIFTGHTFGIGGFGDATFGSWNKIWLVKTDSYGNISWDKRFSGTGHGRTVREIDDGYILCGFHRGDHGHHSEYGFVIKTDENGNID